MKKISKKSARNKAIGSALASLRIEGLVPGDYVVKGMEACAHGKKTTAKMLQEVISHHATLRRI